MAVQMLFADSQLVIEGELTRHSVPLIDAKQMKKHLSNAQLEIDFAKVSRVDTAGLAWLFSIVELAHQFKCQLSLSHLSEDVLKLAKLSGVEQFLPAL